MLSLNDMKEATPEGFTYDYRYASKESVHQSTVEQLAKLELELHLVRMAFVVNGSNPDIMVAPNRKIGDEMKRIENGIKLLETHFASFLVTE